MIYRFKQPFRLKDGTRIDSPVIVDDDSESNEIIDGAKAQIEKEKGSENTETFVEALAKVKKK